MGASAESRRCAGWIDHTVSTRSVEERKGSLTLPRNILVMRLNLVSPGPRLIRQSIDAATDVSAARRIQFALQRDSVASILTLRCATQEVKQRLAHDAGAQFHNHHREMVTAIFKEVERVVATHKARAAEWYNEVGSPASILHVLVVNPAPEPWLLKAWTLMAERRTVGERDEGGDAA